MSTPDQGRHPAHQYAIRGPAARGDDGDHIRSGVGAEDVDQGSPDRAGNWTQRTDHMGRGLTGRTLGIVGAGGTGQETLRLVRGFDMRLLAADPYADAAKIEALGAKLVPLPTLLRESDFVVLTVLLNDETAI